MALTPIEISDELKQAFWRLALNGNPHWEKYYSSAGQPRGMNDKPASLGYVSKDNRDTRDQASKPYFYTPDVVDQHKLGFGFWSRSSTEAATYRFAAFDIEPLIHSPAKRVNRNPSADDVRATLDDAVRITKAAQLLAQSRQDLLWVLLVETSQHHYHVWLIFEQPVEKPDHDQVVSEVLNSAGPVSNLDKSTLRASAGLGDQFRAPWSWKRQRQSQAIHSWIRDQELVLRLAREARPRPAPGSRFVCFPSHSSSGRLPVPAGATELNGSQGKSSERYPGGSDSHEQFVAALVARFPIHGPGMRNAVQCRLVATLVNRDLTDAQILDVGKAWLGHFEAQIGTPLPEAVRLLQDCLRRTRGNPKFANRRPTVDYGQLHRTAILTAADESFLAGKIVMRDGQHVLITADCC